MNHEISSLARHVIPSEDENQTLNLTFSSQPATTPFKWSKLLYNRRNYKINTEYRWFLNNPWLRIQETCTFRQLVTTQSLLFLHIYLKYCGVSSWRWSGGGVCNMKHVRLSYNTTQSRRDFLVLCSKLRSHQQTIVLLPFTAPSRDKRTYVIQSLLNLFHV